jgi:hypothetical protein
LKSVFRTFADDGLQLKSAFRTFADDGLQLKSVFRTFADDGLQLKSPSAPCGQQSAGKEVRRTRSEQVRWSRNS